MKLSRLNLAIALALTSASAQLAQAASMVGSIYEPFDYTVGTQVLAASNLNGGKGWNANGDFNANAATANWGNAAALPAVSGSAHPVVAGLSYTATGYPAATGNAARMDASAVPGTTQNVSRTFIQSVDSGTTYFSFLINKKNDTTRTTSLAFFGTSVGTVAPTTQVERMSIGQIGATGANSVTTNGNFGLLMNNSNNSTTTPVGVLNAASPIALGVNQTHLVVGKIEWNVGAANLFGAIAGFNEQVSIWVDPTDVTSEGAMGAAYLTSNLFELTNINTIRLFAGNTAAAANGNPERVAVSTDFDEIRVAGTFAEAINATTPEPGGFALLALGGLALGAFRKR